jgi:hypothetical protein
MGMGKTLKQRYKAAVAERNIQREGHHRLTASLDDELVDTWEAMCVAWEKDVFPKTKANPHETDKASKCFLLYFSQFSNSFLIQDLTEAEFCRQLGLEEEHCLVAGGIALHTTTVSAFIMMGLDLEETQCVPHLHML